MEHTYARRISVGICERDTFAGRRIFRQMDPAPIRTDLPFISRCSNRDRLASVATDTNVGRCSKAWPSGGHARRIQRLATQKIACAHTTSRPAFLVYSFPSNRQIESVVL